MTALALIPALALAGLALVVLAKIEGFQADEAQWKQPEADHAL